LELVRGQRLLHHPADALVVVQNQDAHLAGAVQAVVYAGTGRRGAVAVKARRRGFGDPDVGMKAHASLLESHADDPPPGRAGPDPGRPRVGRARRTLSRMMTERTRHAGNRCGGPAHGPAPPAPPVTGRQVETVFATPRTAGRRSPAAPRRGTG